MVSSSSPRVSGTKKNNNNNNKDSRRELGKSKKKQKRGGGEKQRHHTRLQTCHGATYDLLHHFNPSTTTFTPPRLPPHYFHHAQYPSNSLRPYKSLPLRLSFCVSTNLHHQDLGLLLQDVAPQTHYRRP